ncbi:MAG TPA: hypothetical protein VK701_01880 [Solirubrobacteraceae bacterium]|jgi:hypothetical protein|nr:hypothetical protein [Solirubrobacteraceae bacterium]
MDAKISDTKPEQLETEVARSKIYEAAYSHLQSLGLRPGVEGFDWSLDFTLHFGLDSPDVGGPEGPGRIRDRV